MNDLELHHWIDGRPAPAASGATFANVAPATGQTVARVARGDGADIDAAVAAARGALDGAWGRMTAPARADLLDAVAARLEVELDDLAALESRDTGKPIALARRIDIPRAIANFRFFAGALRHDETPCHAMPGALNYTLRKPVGVVGLVTPWNLPLYLLTWKAAPALAMGNAIVAKPSEMTPLTADALATEVSAAARDLDLAHDHDQEQRQARADEQRGARRSSGRVHLA